MIVPDWIARLRHQQAELEQELAALDALPSTPAREAQRYVALRQLDRVKRELATVDPRAQW